MTSTKPQFTYTAKVQNKVWSSWWRRRQQRWWWWWWWWWSSSSSLSSSLSCLLYPYTDINQDYWIGLSDLGIEGTYDWTDGIEAGYTHWADDEPSGDEFNFEQDCVRVCGGYWKDTPCDWSQPYICELNISTQIDPWVYHHTLLDRSES